MKKSLLTFGKELSKSQQLQINGKGGGFWCAGGNAPADAPRCPVPCFMGNCFL
ncbi:hypothetical protein [uncultured Aquimarina sp.]|uniref:hypothetical protein n=1 Tax=uncultured Aquimarina sp. TaxID=575652 RepID=UPI00261C7C70|nr:hypothetical protein [uncultured Aquimarina sp.]